MYEFHSELNMRYLLSALVQKSVVRNGLSVTGMCQNRTRVTRVGKSVVFPAARAVLCELSMPHGRDRYVASFKIDKNDLV